MAFLKPALSLREALENLTNSGEFVVESWETSQLAHAVNGLREDCDIAREAMGRLAVSDAATVSGRWACAAGRMITCHGQPFVNIRPVDASPHEADNCARALPALLELAALVRIGNTSAETLERIAGLALDTIEGKGQQ